MAQTTTRTTRATKTAAAPAATFQAPAEPAKDRYARFRDPDKDLPPAPPAEGQMLYDRIEQPTKPPNLRLELPMITPEMAKQMMAASYEAEPTFTNRKFDRTQLARWKGLLSTGRFVFWAEDAPILVTDRGVMLNGWHRLTAVVETGIAAGFLVIHGARREHMVYYDQGKTRNLAASHTVATGAPPKFQAASAARLGARFEEFVLNARPATGWRQWGTVKSDEHADVIKYLKVRDGLTDTYAEAQRIYGKTSLLVPSLMVFHFYQLLAWEEGWEELEKFWKGLLTGAALPTGHPVLMLREYGRQYGYGSMPAKREAHLLLLDTCFRATARGESLKKVEVGYGLPMVGPYHPQGDKAAAANLRKAIEERKRELAPA